MKASWFDYHELPSVIANARELRGLSLREAGKQIGVSPATLCRIERCQHVIDISTAARIAAWLNSWVVILPRRAGKPLLSSTSSTEDGAE